MNRTKIKLVVYDDYVLGYILPELPNDVQVLHESVLRGGCRASTRFRASLPITPTSDVRLATKSDFYDYRVSFKGFEDKNEYLYME